MEVHLSPELEKRVTELVIRTGLTADELIEEALAGYANDMDELRHTLDRRYDEVKSGEVKLVDGKQAIASLLEKSRARRKSPA